MKRNVICVMCESEFETTGSVAKYCSVQCRRNKINADQNRKKYEKLALNSDAIPCRVCGVKLTNLTFHITKLHGISISEYSEKYGGPLLSPNVAKKLSEASTGEKNGAYQHGGKYSPWSDKSTCHSAEEIAESKKKAKDNYTKDKRDTTLEYYLAKGMTDEEAVEARSNRQRTFSLEKCIAKHGEEKGAEVFAKRQEKWHTSYVKTNFSKISQRLFWQLASYLDLSDVYFAELAPDKSSDASGRNNEHVIRIGYTCCKPDFIVTGTSKIIEFDGDYWHGSEGNIERTKRRDSMLLDAGYAVFHVKECDFNADPEKVIKECLDFLEHDNKDVV